ncbi:MAG TPA: hypothetical protein VEL06_08730 [Haliangiales bacterium]|nr:hypothetical protein [Haliangiales bacterium]
MGALVDLTNLTTKLIESVKDRKFAADLREIQRMIASLQSEHASIHESRIALMTENAELKRKLAALELRVADAEKRASQQQADLEQFVEHRGALFKRKPDGGFHEAVYCPKCHTSTSSPDGHAAYHCYCGWRADFNGFEFRKILKDLLSTHDPKA